MIQTNTIKTIFNTLLLMSTLSKVNGTVRQFHLHLHGEVSNEYGPHVLGQIPNVSKSVCASMCLENAKCHAVEICNLGVSECRITTGQHPSPVSNGSRSTCQLYRLVSRTFNIGFYYTKGRLKVTAISHQNHIFSNY